RDFHVTGVQTCALPISVRAMLSVAVALGLLYLSFTAGAPFLLALVVAIFLEPVNLFLIKRLRLNRLVSAIITCTLFTIGLLGLRSEERRVGKDWRTTWR